MSDHETYLGDAVYASISMPIRLRPTHTSYAIYPVAAHNAPCHIEGTGRMDRTG